MLGPLARRVRWVPAVQPVRKARRAPKVRRVCKAPWAQRLTVLRSKPKFPRYKRKSKPFRPVSGVAIEPRASF